MSTIAEEIQALKAASAEQTAASQALAQEVAGKMGDIDQKVDQSIEQVEETYDEKASNLTIIATDGYRKAVESASGGKNTVVYDAQGNPNVMVVVPRFNIEDLDLIGLDLGTGTHPAFQTNGTPRSEILIGKYLASNAVDGTAVVGGAAPRGGVNFDVAKGLCTQKGEGWHLMSIHEWAAVALWSLANNTVPRGNTNNGRSHQNKWEVAPRADGGKPGDAGAEGYSLTGKGHLHWSHDHSAFGIMDLVGNLSEWIDQMKLVDGRILTTLDNDPSVAEANWFPHQAYYDLSSEGGSPILNTSVNHRTGNLGDSSESGASKYLDFKDLQRSMEYTPIQLLRALLLETASVQTLDGRLNVRNHGERFPLRGGHHAQNTAAGMGALDIATPRTPGRSIYGFRPALFV